MQQESLINQADQTTVFIHYHQDDALLKDELVRHLRSIPGLIPWSWDQTFAGENTEQAIDQAIDRAKIAILLITANYLSTKVNGNTENKLRKKHQTSQLRLIPVIAKPCAWQSINWLTKLTARPKHKQPVWREQGIYVDNDLSDISTEIGQLIKPSPPIKIKTPAKSSSLEESSKQTSISEFTSTKKSNKFSDPDTTLTIIGIAVAIVGVIVAILTLIVTAWDVLPSGAFDYPVLVQDKVTETEISGAMITIEVENKAPLDEITDINGYARFRFDAGYDNEPSKIIVEAEGYERYTNNLNLTSNALPDSILLEPVTTEALVPRQKSFDKWLFITSADVHNILGYLIT